MSDDEDDIKQHQFKVIVLGDGAVGKTSICMRFSEDRFSQVYKQTVGVDFFISRLELSPTVHVSLQLWDIGGQSIGSKMITNYISGADAIFLCYDVTNYDSFCNLEDWYRLVLQTFGGDPLPYTVLVGNKNDLRHMAAVRADQHTRFADENQLVSFLMSAKNGDHVKSAFFKLACQLTDTPHSAMEQAVSVNVIPAIIVDHERHDKKVNKGRVPEYAGTPSSVSSCIIS